MAQGQGQESQHVATGSAERRLGGQAAAALTLVMLVTLAMKSARAAAFAVLWACLLTGCASSPDARQPAPGSDGPPARVPPFLERVPNATPRIEPLRIGGPNKPYEVLGQRHVPLTSDQPLAETGMASWYGRKYHGRPTSSGEIYDMFAMTAAHKTMPIPSFAWVRNPANGREIIVRVNDRGPFVAGRVIDLSYTAALKLDLLRSVAPVQLRRITHAEIRALALLAGADDEPSGAAAWAANAPGDAASR